MISLVLVPIRLSITERSFLYSVCASCSYPLLLENHYEYFSPHQSFPLINCHLPTAPAFYKTADAGLGVPAFLVLSLLVQPSLLKIMRRDSLIGHIWIGGRPVGGLKRNYFGLFRHHRVFCALVSPRIVLWPSSVGVERW